MKQTKFKKPYIKIKGVLKVNISGLNYKKPQKGVYLIRNKENKRIYYIGKSNSTLYKTILRHFQIWKDRTQERFTYDYSKFEVKVYYCTTEKQTNALEKLYINLYKPLDNLENKFKKIESEIYLNELADKAKNAPIIEDAPF